MWEQEQEYVRRRDREKEEARRKAAGEKEEPEGRNTGRDGCS